MIGETWLSREGGQEGKFLQNAEGILNHEIRDRADAVTEGEGPSGSSIVSTLEQMDEAAQQMKQGDRIIEWDSEKETLNFPDPYFLYFLRWRTWR